MNNGRKELREIKFRALNKKYEIGDDGSVWSIDFNHTGKRKKLKQYLDEDGYPHVFLNIDGKRSKLIIHRVVAKLFLPPKPTFRHQVNHKNGIRVDNDVQNLEWVTSKENTFHGWRVNGRTASDKMRQISRRKMVDINIKKWGLHNEEH